MGEPLELNRRIGGHGAVCRAEWLNELLHPGVSCASYLVGSREGLGGGVFPCLRVVGGGDLVDYALVYRVIVYRSCKYET